MRFNPRAREGRDLLIDVDARKYLRVSIHAPARGATLVADRLERVGDVSIHAPARGATADRGDHLRGWYVSIHAPARGATEFSA